MLQVQRLNLMNTIAFLKQRFCDKSICFSKLHSQLLDEYRECWLIGSILFHFIIDLSPQRENPWKSTFCGFKKRSRISQNIQCVCIFSRTRSQPNYEYIHIQFTINSGDEKSTAKRSQLMKLQCAIEWNLKARFDS